MLLLCAKGDVRPALSVWQQRLAPLADGLPVSANDQAATELFVNLYASKEEL